MGQIRYYHVPEKELHRLSPHLREWELHTLTPEEAEERYKVFIKTRDEAEDTRPLSFIGWFPAFDGCIGRGYGCLVFRFPEGTWLTEEQYRRAVRRQIQRQQLDWAVQWVALKGMMRDTNRWSR